MLNKLLRLVGHCVPDIRYVRAVPNRVLKPIQKALGLSGGVVEVMGFKMRLNPQECVDGWLWFSPQLYDRQEINFLLKHFPPDGVFLDLGANIGFWTLRFAHGNPSAQVITIEANPATFQVLNENIELNGLKNVKLIQVGVSDSAGKLPLYCNVTGNRGGDSFSSYADTRGTMVQVEVKPLARICCEVGITKVDVMKIDIEGFEERVLKSFFRDAPKNLWPKYICAEILHVPDIVQLLQRNGYQVCIRSRENSVFKLITSI